VDAELNTKDFAGPCKKDDAPVSIWRERQIVRVVRPHGVLQLEKPQHECQGLGWGRNGPGFHRQSA
jgi:hypothetical protein